MTAYESEIYGPEDSRRATWRPDRYSRCPTGEAGHYLAFLASLGYELTPVERAVADGTAYTGDAPTITAEDGSAADRGTEDGEPGDGGQDEDPGTGDLAEAPSSAQD